MIFILFVILVVFGYLLVVIFGVVGMGRLGMGGLGMDFWWEFVIFIMIMLFGYWIEMNVVMGVFDVFGELVRLLFDEVEVLYGDYYMMMFVVLFVFGDLVLVWFGVLILVDGEVVEGEF